MNENLLLHEENAKNKILFKLLQDQREVSGPTKLDIRASVEFCRSRCYHLALENGNS